MAKMKRVLIAGAGPVGMTAALALSKAGIPVTVFERNSELAEDLRASTWHPPTMDMMSRLGLAEDIIRDGLIARYTQHRDRKTGAIAEFDMELLRGETDHPYRVQYEQFKYTRLVHARLAAYPDCKVILGAKIAGVSQTGDKVSVKAEIGGATESHEGDYLIGSDGAWSAVRQALGIDFEGLTYPERFYVATTTFEFADVLNHLCYVNYIADTDEWCVLLRVRGTWRCLFPTRVDESDDEVMSDASTEARLQGVWKKPQAYDTIHRTLYKVHQRVAKSYRSGRVFLAGDAAHINNPLGGMGMNGGIHDGLNLCDKLISLHRGEADESVLDRYERQRRPIAIEFINANTARNKKLMEERDPAARKRQQDAICAQADDPVAAKAFLMKTSMIESLRASELVT